ncbi:hypothetical protein PHYSODRAFT_421265, partial [Phytophthora sojae]
LVFQAHPLLHRFPWEVPETVSNCNVLSAIKKLPFKAFKQESGRELRSVVARLETTAAADPWQRGAMQQTPKQLWAHKNSITEYQVWVSYRAATKQLNLFFDGRQMDASCRKLQSCQHRKETLTHILWECPRAQACWKYLISCW